MPRIKLNPNQAKFAALVSKGQRPIDAYRAVYPGDYSDKSASTKAGRLMRHPAIDLARRKADIAQAAMDQVIARYGITADRVADAMARLAFTDINQVCKWGSRTDETGKVRQYVEVLATDDIEAPALAAISEIKRLPSGELTVRLFNKPECLMNIARLKGWIADKPVDQRSLTVLKIER